MVEDVGVAGACLISRDAEFAALGDFLSSGAAPWALVFTGGPGIGKTSLWEAGLYRAKELGLRVLAARPNEAEAQHPFAGLFDLMDGVGADVLGGLPVPQRQALEAAVLRSEPAAAAQPFAIAAGFLGALRSLAAAGPLLLAVDDLQWLDTASADVLAFAARRIQDPRCRFLFARRSGDQTAVERALSRAAVWPVDITALSVDGTHRLLSQRLGRSLPRRTLSQVFEATQGNPLLVLELGRMLASRGAVELGPDLPLTDLAGNPFGSLVAGLARPARQALLAAALNGHVSRLTLEAVANPAAVDQLVAGGLLVADGGRVRPSHPLLAVAVRRKATTRERRAAHLDLAGVAGDETVRARHLALATPGTDAGLAGLVAAAAAVALRRGAAHDAADLAKHAVRLTPAAAPEVSDRLLALAECLVRVGEMQRARDLLVPRIGGLPPGAARARAHLLVAEAVETLAEHEHHLDLALVESAGEPALQATAQAAKSVLLSVIRVERIREAQACALQAQVLARSARDAPVERHALVALAWARVLRGLPAGEPGGQAPVETEESGLYESSIERPAAVRLVFRGRVGPARAAFRRLAALAEERGEYGFRSVLQIQLCEVELRAGDVRGAARQLDQWHEWAAMDHQETTRARCQALLAAIQGLPEETERRAALALAAAVAADQDLAGLRWDQLEILRARGIAALLAQQPERAAEALGSVWEYTRREGVDDPGAFPVAPDLVEALVRLGRTAEAAAVTGRLRELADGQRHP